MTYSMLIVQYDMFLFMMIFVTGAMALPFIQAISSADGGAGGCFRAWGWLKKNYLIFC